MVIDTESTGTKDSQVCQFAYIDFSSGQPKAGNMYFEVDDMSSHAHDLHGLSMAKLHRLSGGQRFVDQLREVNWLLNGRRLVGHSVGCDIRALRAEFTRVGYMFPIVHQFCTMAHFAPIMNVRVEGQKRPKNPSLSELCKYLAVTDEEVLGASCGLYGVNTNQHDARYDVCATYLCLQHATERGMLRGFLPEVN